MSTHKSELVFDTEQARYFCALFVLRSVVVVLKSAHVSAWNKVRVKGNLSLHSISLRGKKEGVGLECCPESNCQSGSSSSRLYFLPVVLLLLSALIFFSVYHEFTFYSVRPFLRVGRGGEASGVFSSFPLRKQSEKTKTRPHISFIVSSSSFPFSVYSEYKINTDGIEQSSL